MPTLQTTAGRLSWFDNGLTADTVPTLLLLHSGGASHRQWRPLIAQLGQTWRILAPDLVGHGDTPQPSRKVTVEEEVALLAALLQQVEGPLHVIGHSFGGAMALELARLHPDRIAAVAVYEPVMFRLLRDSTHQQSWREIALLGQRHVELVNAGDLRGAASAFLGYWIAPGAFEAMPEPLQAGVAATMAKVADDFTLMLQPGPVDTDFSALTMPLLLLHGSAPTLAVRGVLAELRRLLPATDAGGPRWVEVAGARHMAPVQKPDLVNPLLVDFLDITLQVAQRGLHWAG